MRRKSFLPKLPFRLPSWRVVLLVIVAGLFFFAGGMFIWLATLRIPDLQSFDTYDNKLLKESTKLYDRTGEVLLFNLNQDVRRTVVPFEEISPHLKRATIAIEDTEFYNHKGVRPTAILRAALVNLLSGGFKQGGSTITQQVVKNSLLTVDKKISRKIKEALLAIRVEQNLTKDEILNLYLNGTPYGGTMYGVEEASLGFFGKRAKDVTLAEAAYIAAVPQAPSYYSPFGRHLEELENRKNLVLRRMLENNLVTQAEYDAALAEKVVFKPSGENSLKAPHFVMYIKALLEEKYGKEVVRNGDLKVTTTIDWELQDKAEDIVHRYALDNTNRYNAENAGLVAIDPKTGQILVMVGSRDYFDEKIDGNYNVALAKRQPGSSFKPFVYAAAFEKGYTPDTILFDVETEFNTNCSPQSLPGDKCYRPKNYDDIFRGPMTIRSALAQSINIPAVKALYLVGIDTAIKRATAMGISGLETAKRYGLTLVLGGGEVSLLDMTSAYAVFANEGVRLPHTGILKVEDRNGRVLEEYKEEPIEVLDPNVAREISDILSDNAARAPSFSASSPMNVPGRDVAAKTGTTNDTRDAWILGYTPSIAVGAWAGNNDNRPMVKQVAGYIVAPMWRAFLDEALAKLPNESFTLPAPRDPNIKPVLRGVWQSGTSYAVNPATGEPAPIGSGQFRVISEPHSILHWVNKDDPNGPYPTNPGRDPQYYNWEYGVSRWFFNQYLIVNPIATSTASTTFQNSNSTTSGNNNNNNEDDEDENQNRNSRRRNRDRDNDND
jgi:1A family penicillin-binding protein